MRSVASVRSSETASGWAAASAYQRSSGRDANNGQFGVEKSRLEVVDRYLDRLGLLG